MICVVLQYQTCCQELEQQLEAGGGSLPDRWGATEDHSLEKALLQLEEEQQRCENLAEVNTLLREHLNKASEVNSALKEDIGKLTSDWMRAREELDLKESEWRDERELYDSYFRGERNRLLSLWRQVVTFRRHFLEMKTATDRDLSELKAEQMRLSGSILVNCSRQNSGIQLWEPARMGRAVLKDHAQQQGEQEISHKGQEVPSFQVKGDLEKKELQDRVLELSALLVQSQKQNEEKEKTVKTLNDTVEILEACRLEKENEATLTKRAKEENLSLQKVIKDITQVVLDDSESMVSIIFTESSQHAESSNILSCLSSIDAEDAFALIQEALARRRGATQALKEELSARQDSISSLLHQHRQQEEKCRKLQQRLEELEEECKTSCSHQQHLQSLVEALKSDCASLEKTREELQQQLEVTEQEVWRLRQSNTELQLKEDSAQGEKVEQQETVERARHDQELLLKDVSALEGKLSLLQSELVIARETLKELYLQRDLLKQEKQELTMALEKAEQSGAELTGAQNNLSAEIADLHDAAVKMSSINEALALDKVQLNKLVLQLEQENEVLSGKVDEMERAKISAQEKLNWCERTNAELSAEKAHLEQLLKIAEEQQEGLRVELRILAEEKAETQEKLNQVCCQQESASSGLEQLRQESSRQGYALAKVFKEKEFLVHEKAALEVRLEAVERDRQGLSEQLAEARSVKETLESSLFEAQQHLSQLEISSSQLEIQLHTVMQAKEVIQGEVKCLQCELEAERSLMRQERENMAQQLLRTEQQYNNTLRLRQNDHEVEIKKLMQDLASEQEGHHSELQDMLEQWEKEKAETEGEHKKKMFDMKQKVATMQAQQEEERTRVENAKQEVLLEKEREKNVLLETLLQTQGELREACQQVEQLRQEVEEQRENGQNITEKLQAELQETQSKIKAIEKRHEEEVKTMKEEINILLQQRDALQKQVEELTSQLAASEESQQVIGRKAEQDVCEAQELSRQKVLEVVHLQKILEEERSQWEKVEHQNKELQVCLQSLEGERSRWEEVEYHNTELQALLKVLENEKNRLTLSLEERELSLRTLEENNLAQHEEVSRLLSAIHQAEQLHSDHRREKQELNNQIQSLQAVVLEKEAGLAAQEKQLLQDLEESKAGEQRLKDSLHVLEAEMSELRLTLCSTENKAKALATECQQAHSARCEARSQLDKLHLVLHRMIWDSRDLVTSSSEQGHVWSLAVSQARDLPAELTADRVAAALQDLHQHLKQTQQDLNDARKKIQDLELELSKRQAERDHFSTHNQELQKQLAQSQEETQMAERKNNSLQAALQEKSAALKKEAVSLHQEVASLERKLESTEKQRKGVLVQSRSEKIGSMQMLTKLPSFSPSTHHSLFPRLACLPGQDERDRLQAVKEKLVREIKALQESLTASETRANTAVDMNHYLEQELQTTLSILKIKNEEVETQQEKIHMLQTEAAQGKALQETLTHMTDTLSEREGEMKLYQEQMRVMENQKEVHNMTLDQVIEAIIEKKRKIESQLEQIEELEKQQEKQKIAASKMSKGLEERDQKIKSQQEQIQQLEEQRELQRAVMSKMSKELEERDQEIRTQQEQIWELEEQRELQRTVVSKMSKELEERDQEIKLQEGKIMILEQRDASQVRNLLMDLDHMKENLKEKNSELMSLTQQIRELEMGRGQVKSLHTSLEQLRAALKDKESECDSQRDQLRLLQQHKEQQEGHLQELHGKVEKMTLSLSKKDQELESLREGSMKVALTSCQKQVNLLEEVVRKKDEDMETLMQKLQCQEEELKTLKNLQLRLTKNDKVRHHKEQEKLLEEAWPEREQETKVQDEQKELEEEIRALREDLQHVQQTLTKKDEEITCQRDQVRYLEKTLTGREQELKRQSELLKQLTSALRWKGEGETLKKQIQKLLKWEDEEAEKRKVLQERDHLLQRQKELTQQLEDERKAKGKELERLIAILKQSESEEIEWKEKAQALTLALTESEMANRTLKEEIAILQSMVSERDKDRFRLQQATAKGEQLSWLSEKRVLSQRLECLQQAVARLELEKTELKQLNAELRRTLEQVERERRRLKRNYGGRSLPDTCRFPQHKIPASRQEESQAGCSCRLGDLQNQVSLLQTQLAEERKYKQDYIECCAKTSQELSDLHQELSYSLAAVVREPEAAVLEAETRKLDQSLNLNLALTSLDHQFPERQPLHSTVKSARTDDLS
ncbi:centrosome-associated protein CEP250 isoform X3 [Tyto alba]|uniref:centrosome-associated protein CEP250 isoform X3 n=1 Tax=Tyto alba TaxID=56313 RepID=UPI001C67B1F1|nr:centrosome-associated protein CEP250 isoform X3 [Tyto alba]